MEDDAWRLLEPPPQLFQISDDASDEIKDVVEAFGAHCIAIHDSAKQGVGLSESEDEGLETIVEEFQSMPGAWTSDLESSDADEPEPAAITWKAKGKWATRAANIAKQSSQSMAQMLRSKSLSRAMGKGGAYAIRGLDEAVECAGCFEEQSAITSAHLACQHWYCNECLVGMTLNAMSSESQWPPQCCRLELPRTLILLHLSKPQAKQFVEKEAEYNTPVKERWYCSRPQCGKWFKPQNEGSHVACPHCSHKMCPHCRGPAHNAKTECQQDAHLAALKKEAEFEGWVRCPECNALIELTQGCRHLTCLCRHQFCWVCSARWLTCSCSETDKTRKLRQIKTRKEARQRREAERAAEHRRAAEQSAIEEAVKKARQLAEDTFAEDIERARIDAIGMHFASLRDELDELHATQCMQIIASRQCEEEAIQSLTKEAAGLETAVLSAVLDATADHDLDAVLYHLHRHISTAQKAADRREQALRERSAFEARWIDLAAIERNALLHDAHEYLLASGGEVPGTMYPHEERAETREEGSSSSSSARPLGDVELGSSKLNIGRMLGLRKTS